MLRRTSFKTQLSKGRFAIAASFIIFVIVIASLLLPDLFSVKYDSKKNIVLGDFVVASTTIEAVPVVAPITHVKTPASVKAIYMTSWVAGTNSIRDNVVNIIDTTEVNAVVIDIKDYTGNIAFKTGDAALDGLGCTENRIRDIQDFIGTLHTKGVYVIGRVAVFQDPCYVKLHPEAAVKRSSDGGIWKDRKGISWMDAGSKLIWDHAVDIARASYDIGFDEINFDYIRFPSDGNMKDIAFPASGSRAKDLVIGDFFRYLDKELRGGKAASSSDPVFDELYASYTSTSTNKSFFGGSDGRSDNAGNGRMVVSADLFGLVTVAEDDLGIGQTLAQTLPYVDYIYPMVYPSHFAAGWNNFKNPADHPYDVVKISMSRAAERTRAQGLNIQKLRPWLQDFDLGATYTAEMVRAQIQATYDAGLTSWLMWDPSNKYTVPAFKK
ncbi:MAG: putative glycoside hydrolase [Patescibacteria group bacterium]